MKSIVHQCDKGKIQHCQISSYRNCKNGCLHDFKILLPLFGLLEDSRVIPGPTPAMPKRESIGFDKPLKDSEKNQIRIGNRVVKGQHAPGTQYAMQRPTAMLLDFSKDA